MRWYVYLVPSCTVYRVRWNLSEYKRHRPNYYVFAQRNELVFYFDKKPKILFSIFVSEIILRIALALASPPISCVHGRIVVVAALLFRLYSYYH